MPSQTERVIDLALIYKFQVSIVLYSFFLHEVFKFSTAEIPLQSKSTEIPPIDIEKDYHFKRFHLCKMCKNIITIYHYFCHKLTDEEFIICSDFRHGKRCKDLLTEYEDFYAIEQLCPGCYREQGNGWECRIEKQGEEEVRTNGILRTSECSYAGYLNEYAAKTERLYSDRSSHKLHLNI